MADVGRKDSVFDRRVSVYDMLLALPATALIEKASTEPEVPKPKPVASPVRPYRNRTFKVVRAHNSKDLSAHRRPQLPLFPRLRRSLPLAGSFSWSSHSWRERTTIDQSYVSAFRVDNFDDDFMKANAQAPGLLTLLQAAAEMEHAQASHRRKPSARHARKEQMRYRFVASPQSAKV